MAQVIVNDRANHLLGLLKIGLQVYADNESRKLLGKRQDYVGLSDIGKYAECPRLAVLQKVKPMQKDFSEMLILQRGHWFEEGIGKALSVLNLNYVTQLEIKTEIHGTPLVAHLDFTLVGESKGKSIVRILEVKSVTDIPANPRTAHFYQVHGQAGLLTENWNNPAFSLKNNHGEYLYQDLTFPQLCEKHFGVLLPENPAQADVEAWLLYLSMKDGRAFGPYRHNDFLMREVYAFAQDFWGDIQKYAHGNHALQPARGFYPLCDFCPYDKDCPKFSKSIYQPEFENLLQELSLLKTQRKEAEEKIKQIEENIKHAYSLSGLEDWIETDAHRFRITTSSGRKSLNREALVLELEKIFCANKIPVTEIEALFARAETVSEPSSRLTIKEIKG